MPKSQPLSLRLDPTLLESLRREARRTARPASQIAQITLDEGLRVRRCPGILFTDGPVGRLAGESPTETHKAAFQRPL